jgi:APA family basic amino acid/polyamine antiporter
MVGAGVFLSMGFMVVFGGMGPGAVLAAWVVGAALALLGTQAYGALAADSGRSGGEYAYLSRYLHPSVGWLAGWGSVLLGFSAPIAVDALAVGAYAHTLAPGLDARLVATGTVVVLALLHARDHATSRFAQDALIAVKVLLLLAFVGMGLGFGEVAWPAWGADRPLDWGAVADQQYWVAFAFSGWNAAVYVAGEFRDPRRDVPRAMLIGCALVGALYLVVNFVFVANLTPGMVGDPVALHGGGPMLGHLVAQNILGPTGATVMSAVTLLVFLSATSAMMLAGPRVVAAMAEDGALPAVFRARDGHPPRFASALQAGVALLLVWTQDLRDAVGSCAAVLLLFTGLVAVCAARLPTARPHARASGALYACFAAALLWRGASDGASVRWVLVAACVALAARFLLTRGPRDGVP